MSTFLIRNKARDKPWTCEAAKDAVRVVRDQQEHWELLLAKTLEETTECYSGNTIMEKMKEAGDILETLISFIYVSARKRDYSREQIEEFILQCMHAKRAELGDFTDGLVLELKRAKSPETRT